MPVQVNEHETLGVSDEDTSHTAGRSSWHENIELCSSVFSGVKLNNDATGSDSLCVVVRLFPAVLKATAPGGDFL